MNFEYYYGTQADQFSFIRIPRILLLDEAFSALSLSAKVLYSVLLDRMGLSMKNKWFDEENKVLLAVASGILLFFLWIGVFMEVILESAQHKIGEWIIK